MFPNLVIKIYSTIPLVYLALLKCHESSRKIVQLREMFLILSICVKFHPPALGESLAAVAGTFPSVSFVMVEVIRY